METSSTSCTSPTAFPISIVGAIGGLAFDSKPTICGGLKGLKGLRGLELKGHQKDCYSYSRSEWTKGNKHSLF